MKKIVIVLLQEMCTKNTFFHYYWLCKKMIKSWTQRSQGNVVLIHQLQLKSNSYRIPKDISWQCMQCPECSATGMGEFSICKLKWDLFRTSVTTWTIDKNTFSAPFGIFFVKTAIRKDFFRKSLIQPPNGVQSFENFHFQITLGWATNKQQINSW